MKLAGHWEKSQGDSIDIIVDGRHKKSEDWKIP